MQKALKYLQNMQKDVLLADYFTKKSIFRDNSQFFGKICKYLSPGIVKIVFFAKNTIKRDSAHIYDIRRKVLGIRS